LPDEFHLSFRRRFRIAKSSLGFRDMNHFSTPITSVGNNVTKPSRISFIFPALLSDCKKLGQLQRYESFLDPTHPSDRHSKKVLSAVNVLANLKRRSYVDCHTFSLVAPYHSCSIQITHSYSMYSLSAINILANLKGGSNVNCHTVVLVAPHHSCSIPITYIYSMYSSVLSIFLLI
jgi:hypothetical protein